MAGILAPFVGLGLSTMLDHSDAREKARRESASGSGDRLHR
jgi:hypothetical protein